MAAIAVVIAAGSSGQIAAIALVIGEIQVGGDIVGMNVDGSAVVHGGVLAPALAGQEVSEDVFGNEIVAGEGQCAQPERFAVVPIADLAISEGPEQQQTSYRGNGKPSDGEAVCFGPIRDEPRHHQKQANEWDIGVAICHGLRANLYQSNHGHEAAQKPEPSDGEIAAVASARDENERGDQNQCQRGRSHLPGGIELRGMRIQRDQVRRPKGFSQIADVRDHASFDAQEHAVLSQSLDGTSGSLGLHGHEHAGDGEQQERQFFQKEPSERHALRAPGLSLLTRDILVSDILVSDTRRTDSVERPVVQQQQQKRKRNYLRLAEQAERKQKGHGGISAQV